MKKHTVLVALDGSAFSRQIIPAICRLLHPVHYRLILLHVEEPLAGALGTLPVPIGWAMAGYGYGQEFENLRRPTPDLQPEQSLPPDLDCVLATERTALETAGYTVATAVRFGVPSQQIVDAVNTMAIDMLAMATHGRTGISKVVLGSVVEAVLPQLHIPLLLVRPHGEASLHRSVSAPRTIVVPLDGSAFAEQALAQAQIVAADAGAALVLVGCAPIPDDTGLAMAGVVPSWLPAQELAEREHLEHYLSSVAGMLAAKGFKVAYRLLANRPQDAILQTSAELHADLIVMASHGRSGLQRMLLGSVTAQVLHGAEVPVLLVRPKNASAA